MLAKTIAPVARRYDILILSACLLLEIIGITLIHNPRHLLYTLLLLIAPLTVLLLVMRLVAPRLSTARREYWFSLDWLFAPFEQPSVTSSLIQYTTDVIRILVGVFTIYMYVDSTGYAILEPDPGGFVARNLVFIGFGILLTLGLFTPLSCVALLVVLNATNIPLGFLFNRVLLGAFAWIFLLLGAGRRYSLDAYLMKRSGFRWLAAVYQQLPTTNWKNYAMARLLIVMVYWGISVMAMRGHLQNNYWRHLESLQIIFTAPWLTDHYGLYEDLRAANLQLSFLVLAVVVIGQMINEMFLLPLFFFKWGRVFAALQWLGFALGSIFILTVAANVPQFEIFLWVLLFLPGIIAFWRKRHPSQSPPPMPPAETLLQRHKLGLVVTCLASYCILFYVACVVLTIPRLQAIQPVANFQNDVGRFLEAQPFRRIMLLFSQIASFDVYNTYDILASQTYAVIAETDTTGRIRRVVPFLDYYGGRLDYIANNYMVYYQAAPWQRGSRLSKVETVNTLGEGANYLQNIIYLDLCLTGIQDAMLYRVYLFDRPLESGTYTHYWVWQPTLVSITDYVVDPVDFNYIHSQRERGWGLPCYNLPPGQWRSDQRLADTHVLLEQAQAAYINRGGIVKQASAT